MFLSVDKLTKATKINCVMSGTLTQGQFGTFATFLSFGYFHRFGVKIPPSKKCWGYFLIGQFMGSHQFAARLFSTKFNAILEEEKFQGITELLVKFGYNC